MPDSKSRQGLVDDTFDACMARDERDIDTIRDRIREAIGRAGSSWNPTDHQLQMMVSRNTIGRKTGQFFSAHTKPPRYISKARIEELIEETEGCPCNGAACLTCSTIRGKLRNQLEDLEHAFKVQNDKHVRVYRRARQLAAIVETINTRALEVSR